MRLAGSMVFALSLIPAAVQALPQPYLPGASAGSLTSARAVVARDFDRDGDLDLAASSLANGGELIWFEASAAGFVRHPIATGLNRGVALAAGDFDCDGDEDLVVALDLDDAVVWYENDLPGAGWTLGGTVGSGDGVSSVAVVELNGDGQLDVVSSAAIGDEILRFRNNGCASSWSAGIVASGVNAPRELAVGDLNGDGRQDVVAAVQAQDLLAYWSNPGSGGGWAQITIDAAFDSVFSTDVGDIDGDGDLDVAAAGTVANEFAWWANPGGSGAWSKTSIGLEPNATTIRLADLDRDGDLDALTAAVLLTSPVGWYENTAGNGSAWSFHALEVGLSVVVGLTAADLGGDGDLDVVAAGTTTHEIRLWENASTHRNAALGDYGSLSYLQIYREIPDWEMGDLNGDGLPDLVLIDRDSTLPDAQVYWLPNEGPQPSGVVSFGFEPAMATVSTHLYEDLAVGDMDGDGDLDVVIGEAGSVVFAVTLCRNQLGTIPPWSCGPEVTSLFKVDGLGVGDLDRDGDLDVTATVQSFPGDPRNAVWWELSNQGTTWTEHTIQSILSSGVETKPIDLDGDGDLDVATERDDWWRNDGGTPITWLAQSVPGSTIVNTTFADLDRDGDIDLAAEVLTASGAGLSWFENDLAGSGTWIEHNVRTPDVNTSSEGLSLADLDLDGDADLVAGLNGVAGERLAWFENNIAAGFGNWTERQLAQPQDIPAQGFRVFTADFDHDGDPDVVGGEDAGRFASWLNGGGQYALESRSIAPATASPGAELALLALDATHHGRSGEAAIELAAVALTFEETGGGPLASSELAELVTVFRLYLDDGSGSFDAGLDTEVAALVPPLLTNGLGVLVFADDVPALALQAGAATTTYFLTAEVTTNALGVGIADLAVSHEPALGSVAEDVLYDTPVTREAGTGATATFTIADPFLFADGFESGDTSAWALVFP